MNTGFLQVVRTLLAASLVASAGANSATGAEDERRATAGAGDRRFLSIDSAQEKRAEALLARAVEHVRQHGEAGAADFSRQSAFVDRDLYAYALRTDGKFLASGGASVALVGENVLPLTDSEGKLFMREMVETAKAQGGGRVQYQWYNPADSTGEPKLTLFRKVDEVVVAVGFYPPRAAPADARALLDRAVEALKADEKAALTDFQAFPGPFIRDDLYVFVVDLETGRFRANGANPGLVGTDARALRDANGRPIVTDSIALVTRDGEGQLVYSWRNPVTDRVESKHTFFHRLNRKLVGVGYFTR